MTLDRSSVSLTSNAPLLAFPVHSLVHCVLEVPRASWSTQPPAFLFLHPQTDTSPLSPLPACFPHQVSWLVCAGMMNYYVDGGFYPAGGSNTIPERIIPVIEAAGGAVLCKAAAEQILVDEATGKANGVRMANGDELRAPAVVSAVGYENTFERLLPREALEKAGLDLAKGPSSAMEPSHSHICAFISLDGPPGDFDLKPWNIHSMPELPRYGMDISKMQEEFYADPLGAQRECLMTLTCPAAKDPLYGEQFPNRLAHSPAACPSFFPLLHCSLPPPALRNIGCPCWTLAQMCSCWWRECTRGLRT